MNDNQSREPDLQAILAAIESDQTDVDNKIISERNADMASVKKDLQSLKDVTFDVASMGETRDVSSEYRVFCNVISVVP